MAHDERADLLAFLAAQRSAVLAVVDGLDPVQMRTSVVPSGWTPESMLIHLGGAEDHWFANVVGGLPPAPELDEDGDAVTTYRRRIRTADRLLETAALDDAPRGTPDDGQQQLARSVRTVVLHMIEETARHAGHLDIARELIDGTTGLGPR